MRRHLSSAAAALILTLSGCTRPTPGAADFERVPLPAGVAADRVALEVALPGREPVRLDLDTVMAFPSVTFTSADPWDAARSHEWKGVLLLPLLRRLGMERDAKAVEVTAANGYSVVIRTEDLERRRHILAYRMDGRLMGEEAAVHKRGQLQIAIDFDGQPDLDANVYKHQLVWQVRTVRAR